MIINLKGSVLPDGEINFDLAPVYFADNEYVHATELFLQFNKQVKNPNGFITTSLIDMSIVNQEQQLLFFQQSTRSEELYFTPRHIAEYKIRQDCLENCKFKLFLFDKKDKQDFRRLAVQVYLQLKITNEA